MGKFRIAPQPYKSATQVKPTRVEKAGNIIINKTSKSMIDARELRIGNWAEGPHNKEPFQISHGEDIDHIQGNPSFNPIPLTEDILLKCGFEKDSPRWDDSWLWLNGFGVNFHLGSWYWNDSVRSVKLVSLHQLQNIFYFLTGTELEITF